MAYDRLGGETLDSPLVGNEWKLPTDIAWVEKASVEFTKRLQDAGWAAEDAGVLDLGFREALINAIVHGNLGIKEGEKLEGENWQTAVLRKQGGQKSPKSVFVKLDITPRHVAVTVRDEGDGYDWKSFDSLREEKRLESSGRGLLFMGFFDSTERNEKGNEVTLTKNKQAT